MSKYNEAVLNWIEGISVTESSGEILVNLPNADDKDALTKIIAASVGLASSVPTVGPLTFAIAHAASIAAVPLSFFGVLIGLSKSIKKEANIEDDISSAADLAFLAAAIASRLALTTQIPQARLAAGALTAIALTLKYGPELADWMRENMPAPEAISDSFDNFMNWLPRRDPLSLDLDGDGLETIAQAGFSGVLFDHDADGVKTATGWIGRDDGFLARDLNGNGQIDSGAELFGDSTRLRNGQLAKNGFEALVDLDSTSDGVVDANDSAFASLRVWKDANSNGLADAGELRSLADLGISVLNTAHTTGNTNLGDLNFLESNSRRTGPYILMLGAQ